MNFLIIISNQDIASLTFKQVIFSKYMLEEIKNNLFLMKNDAKNKIYIKIIDCLHITCKEEEILNDSLIIDQIIFLTRHSTLSEIKPKSMTVHACGNFGKAELGGLDHTLTKTDPILIRSLLLKLKKNKPLLIKPYEVKQEATHHGPSLSISTIFYEIGSSQEDWKNVDVAEYMLEILFNIINNYDKEEIKKERKWIEAVGIGGSHYCTKFNKKTFDEKELNCFGHVVASYALFEIKERPELLEEAKEKSNSKLIIKEEEL